MKINLKQSNEIEALRDCIVKTLNPAKIYLFGSFAEGKQNKDSDYDFYVIMHDSTTERMLALTTRVYKAISKIHTRAVDVIVNKENKFNSRKNLELTVESEVSKKGVLVYGE